LQNRDRSATQAFRHVLDGARRAHAILALRCCRFNGRFEDSWEGRLAAWFSPYVARPILALIQHLTEIKGESATGDRKSVEIGHLSAHELNACDEC
jgi:hypothetical protein